MIYSEVKALFEALGHRFFDEGSYNLNLYGIRRGYSAVDEFNDILGIAFRDKNGNPVNIEHEGTTLPGLYWLKHRMGNINGTAILKPGQYAGALTFGLHSGYEALVQKGSPFEVWRDHDQDGNLDPNGKIYTDVTGLNMHTTSFKSEVDRIGAYSAGCQVRKNPEDHLTLMAFAKKSAMKYGNSFTYTLIEL